jgi:hypothetical protein
MMLRIKPFIYVPFTSLVMIVSIEGVAAAQGGGGSHGHVSLGGRDSYTGSGVDAARESAGRNLGRENVTEKNAPIGQTFGSERSQEWHSQAEWNRSRRGWRSDDEWTSYVYPYPVYGRPWPYGLSTCPYDPTAYGPYAYYLHPKSIEGSNTIRSQSVQDGRSYMTRAARVPSPRRANSDRPAGSHVLSSAHRLAHSMRRART